MTITYFYFYLVIYCLYRVKYRFKPFMHLLKLLLDHLIFINSVCKFICHLGGHKQSNAGFVLTLVALAKQCYTHVTLHRLYTKCLHFLIKPIYYTSITSSTSSSASAVSISSIISSIIPAILASFSYSAFHVASLLLSHL